MSKLFFYFPFKFFLNISGKGVRGHVCESGRPYGAFRKLKVILLVITDTI